MKCPRCKITRGALVEMAESRTRGLLACTTQHCTATVLLVDVGLMLEPPPPKKKPSSDREPSEISRAPVTRTCKHLLCRTVFTEVSQSEYCEDCRRKWVARGRALAGVGAPAGAGT